MSESLATIIVVIVGSIIMALLIIQKVVGDMQESRRQVYMNRWIDFSTQYHADIERQRNYNKLIELYSPENIKDLIAGTHENA